MSAPLFLLSTGFWILRLCQNGTIFFLATISMFFYLSVRQCH